MGWEAARRQVGGKGSRAVQERTFLFCESDDVLKYQSLNVMWSGNDFSVKESIMPEGGHHQVPVFLSLSRHKRY